MRRLFPHPYLSLLLFIVWLLLVGRLAVGSMVMAAILATVIPLLTSPFWPGRAQPRNVMAFAAYVGIVLYDIVRSNFVVARIVLFMPRDQIRSAWITVPLDLRTREAIVLLAGTITMTPGTLTADMSACGRALLIHSLHAPDPDAVRDEIKTRYEARLKRIFE
jgi:multicomponent K+:H+ antiporter subunit E